MTAFWLFVLCGLFILHSVDDGIVKKRIAKALEEIASQGRADHDRAN